ncbi:hypothetical protein P20495_3721 [Pseudoalteromonas sp. BSi20495]|nr:hypothetical protein P20495_3721 [Pseudoalteromonas sp. BSi20495]
MQVTQQNQAQVDFAKSDMIPAIIQDARSAALSACKKALSETAFAF